jgi:hypothetical protein
MNRFHNRVVVPGRQRILFLELLNVCKLNVMFSIPHSKSRGEFSLGCYKLQEA